MTKESVKVRIPPSPTGNLHIGTARVAIFNFLFAKKNKGLIVLRLEDTDIERSTKEFEDNILESLEWLGITYDEFYRQSERTKIYTNHINKLLDSGKAYLSKEQKKDGGGETEVVRMKNPGQKITFTDVVRGEVTFDTKELGDFVIARAIDDPLYHLAVVVDDFEMGITHVIRGEDHISNTARQILIQQGIGAPRPIYAHIPLIFSSDRSKLSKRHGATAITDYRDKGFLPQAMVNYLAFLSWNPGGEQEIYSVAELIHEFDITKVQKGGAVFNEEKLRWFNREYLLRMDASETAKIIIDKLSSKKLFSDKRTLDILVSLIKERIHVWSDIDKLINDKEFDYFFVEPEYETGLLLWKNEKDLETVKRHLELVLKKLALISEKNFNSENIKNAIWDYAEKEGRGNVLWPLRVALTGKDKSPDPFTVAVILGKEKSEKRIQSAIKKILQ